MMMTMMCNDYVCTCVWFADSTSRVGSSVLWLCFIEMVIASPSCQVDDVLTGLPMCLCILLVVLCMLWAWLHLASTGRPRGRRHRSLTSSLDTLAYDSV